MKFITLEEVLIIHEAMIAIGGGRIQIHDFALFHSAIERPKAQFDGKYLYSSVWLMAASLMQSLVKNHPFDDGNKRTAYASTSSFLSKNNYFLCPQIGEAIEFMVQIDTENKFVEQIAQWLQKHSRLVK